MNVLTQSKKIKTPDEGKLSRRSILGAAPAAGLAAFMIGAKPVHAATDPHVEWLDQWRKFRDEVDSFSRVVPNHSKEWTDWEDTAVKLANTKANTIEGLRAQFAWFKEDLGVYVTDMAGDNYINVLDVIQDGIGGLV